MDQPVIDFDHGNKKYDCINTESEAGLENDRLDNHERRLEKRSTSIYKPVLIYIDGFSSFCLVRNISSRGMAGKVYADFAEDQEISIQFSSGIETDGVIRWVHGEQIGVEFAQLIEVEQVLQNHATHAGTGLPARAPRLQLDCEGEMAVDNRRHPVFIQDISQRGVKLRTSLVHAGEEVMIHLPGMEPRKALVRWTQDGRAGLSFIRPLGFEELAEWVITSRPQPPPASPCI